MEGIIALSIPIIFIVAVTITIVFAINAKKEQRLMMIEKGILPSQISGKRYFTWLKIGVIAIGVGLGGIFSYHFPQMGSTFFIVLLFSGIALVVAHLTDENSPPVVNNE